MGACSSNRLPFDQRCGGVRRPTNGAIRSTCAVNRRVGVLSLKATDPVGRSRRAHLRPDTDTRRLAFEIYSLMLRPDNDAGLFGTGGSPPPRTGLALKSCSLVINPMHGGMGQCIATAIHGSYPREKVLKSGGDARTLAMGGSSPPRQTGRACCSWPPRSLHVRKFRSSRPERAVQARWTNAAVRDPAAKADQCTYVGGRTLRGALRLLRAGGRFRAALPTWCTAAQQVWNVT